MVCGHVALLGLSDKLLTKTQRLTPTPGKRVNQPEMSLDIGTAAGKLC